MPTGDGLTYPSDVAAVIGGHEILARRLRPAHTLPLVVVDRSPRLRRPRLCGYRCRQRAGAPKVLVPRILIPANEYGVNATDEAEAVVAAQPASLTKDPCDLARPSCSVDAADPVPGGER